MAKIRNSGGEKANTRRVSTQIGGLTAIHRQLGFAKNPPKPMITVVYI